MVDHARAIVEQGYTVLPELLDASAIDAIAAATDRVWRELDRPALFSQEDVVLAEDVHVSPVGLTVSGLLGRAPELADTIANPSLASLVRSVLGPSLVLEQVCGVVSDETRPFFFWHHHVGGIDGPDHRGRPYPTFTRAERLVCTLYATPLDDEHGTMLVHPRAVHEPSAPPYEPGREPWPGSVSVRAKAGSVVVIDQSIWHCVTPMTRPGRRHFAAFFARRGDVPRPRRSDATLARAFATSRALVEAYGPSRAS